jgi:hypothetical protein
MTGHTGPVLALAAITDRGWLASGSSDCSVRTSLWNDAFLGMKATVDANLQICIYKFLIILIILMLQHI